MRIKFTRANIGIALLLIGAAIFLILAATGKVHPSK